MPSEIALKFLIPVAVFVIGAGVGSFLNIVIQRLPRGLKIKQSKGSFCPDCQEKIPLRAKIPILSRLMLKGKCKTCGAKTGPRFFFVELLTAASFTAIWLLFSPALGIWGVAALCVFTSLMIAASGIDIDHMIIPDAITLQGLCLGLIFSTVVPQLHNESTWYNGLFSGLVGVAVGFVLLSGIMLLGKLLFGRMIHEYSEPSKFHISQPGGQDDAIFIQLGRDQYQWHYVFFRRWDKLKMKVTELAINDIPQVVQNKFQIVPDGFVIDGHKTELSSVSSVTGKFTRAVVPREVVGYGNVKYVAMIGAFIGWQAVLVTTMAAFAIVFLLRNLFKGNVISFSPFLAAGALIFLLFKLM